MTVKLTDAQLVMTSNAVQREDRCLAAHRGEGGSSSSDLSFMRGAARMNCRTACRARVTPYRRLQHQLQCRIISNHR